MRAQTLAALADAASKPSLPRPHAELDAWLADEERATRGHEILVMSPAKARN
jgi:hypothetical protein